MPLLRCGIYGSAQSEASNLFKRGWARMDQARAQTGYSAFPDKYRSSSSSSKSSEDEEMPGAGDATQRATCSCVSQPRLHPHRYTHRIVIHYECRNYPMVLRRKSKLPPPKTCTSTLSTVSHRIVCAKLHIVTIPKEATTIGSKLGKCMCGLDRNLSVCESVRSLLIILRKMAQAQQIWSIIL